MRISDWSSDVCSSDLLTHDGTFLPITDAMPDKSLRTEELYHAVAIAYGATKDPAYLSIAEWQGRTVPPPAGLALAADLAAGPRPPARRVGHEGVRDARPRRSPLHLYKTPTSTPHP